MIDIVRTARAVAWTSTKTFRVLPKPRAPRHLAGRLRTAYQRADLALVRAMTKLPPSPASAGSPGRG